MLNIQIHVTFNKRRKANWIGHSLSRNCFLKHVTEGKYKGEDRRDGKTRKKT